MIHLIAAKKVRPEGSILFYVGNLALDAVMNGHDKDIVHFRNVDDRLSALISLAKETSGDFAEGILLHLYLDWKWDEIVRKKYIDETGGDWFAAYRNELSLAGSYAFHNIDWTKQLWIDMDALDTNSYGITPRATTDDVKNFVSRNNKWHNNTITKPSPAFSPDLIDEFTSRIAKEFIDWRLQIQLLL
jgi:hypothetical protein